jgi:hypothetical protein
VVLLAFKAFSVCGWRANTLELNYLERFMINKAGETFSLKKDRLMHGHKAMSG